MRTVRSLRVFLALGVGLMAITAGMASDATTSTDAATTGSTDDTVIITQEPAKEENTVQTVTSVDPATLSGESTPKPEEKEPTVTAAEVVETVKEITEGATTSETPIVDGIEAGAETVNDKATLANLGSDLAGTVTEAIPQEGTMTTQVTPEVENPAQVVNNVADTTSDLAQTGANTAATGSLGSGALAQQFAGSDNAGVATAAQVTNQILQSGIIDPKVVQQMAGGANPQAAAGLSALANGAEIASGLSACQASINGNEAEIQQHFTALGTSFVNSDTISGAAAMGQSLIKAWAASSGQEADPMYQLFRIYLDQQGNAGKALTTAQENAYDQLTPQCNAAFDDIVETYNDSKGTVSSLLAGGNKNVTCSNYKNADTEVDMTLCVWPSAVWTKEEKIMANITATFTNYGVQLCDVSFYVINLEKAVAKSPVWLPNANTAFPNGIPKGSEVPIEASVPWSQDIAANAPLVDILKGWSACPNGKATPAPTTKPTPRPTEESAVSGTESACFLTPACQKEVAPYAADPCAAYARLLTSGCSTCSPAVLKSAQASCQKSCAVSYCGLEADKEQTSGAGALSRGFAFVATLAMGAVAAFAL